MTKRFSANINILKRKEPTKNGLMYPYNGDDQLEKIYEKIKKENNLTDEDIKKEIFDPDYICFDWSVN